MARHDSGEDASTDKRLPIAAEDANTSVCAMEFDGAGDSPIGLTSAASPTRARRPNETEHASEPSSDARTLRPPAPDGEERPPAPSPARARLDETPLGVPEVGVLQDVSSVRHLKSLAQSSSQNDLPIFRRVEFEDGRPIHIDDVAEPGRPRKSEAPPDPSRPPPMQLEAVSPSQLVNLNSVVVEEPNRPAAKQPAPSAASGSRQIALAVAMFLLGVGTTLVLVWLMR